MNAKKEAENVYARITSHANYDQMNGIEREWIIKCIEEGLEAHASSKMPTMEEIKMAATDFHENDEHSSFSIYGFETGAKWVISLAKPTKKP